MVFRERTLINSMLSMAPNIVFAPNIRRTQNTDTGRKTQTQLIIGFAFGSGISREDTNDELVILAFTSLSFWDLQTNVRIHH